MIIEMPSAHYQSAKGADKGIHSTSALGQSGIDFRRLADLQQFKPGEPSELGGFSSIIHYSKPNENEVIWESRNPPCENYFPPFNKYVVSLCLQDMPQITWADSRNFRVGSFRKGETAVLCAGRAIYFQSDFPSHFLNLGFSLQTLRSVTQGIVHAHMPLMLQSDVGSQDPVLEALINVLREAAQDGCVLLSPPFLKSLTYAVCLHLIQRQQQKNKNFNFPTESIVKPELDDNDQNRLMNYLYSHIGHRISLDDATQALGISGNKLARHFRQRGGDTFMKFFMQLRLARAYELLKSGQFNATQTAMATGFVDLPHFSRHFKKQYGTPPSTLLHR